MIDIVTEFNKKSETLSIEDILSEIALKFPNQVVFTSSFGLEDQAISHIIFSNNLPIEVITLDTGRNFKETYKTYNKTLEKYKKPIKAYFPNNEEVEQLLFEKGPQSFYNSIEDRKECCAIRKIKPLNRALEGKKVWVTGIRAEQSENRGDLTMFEFDSDRKMIKCNPIIDWTFEQTREFINKNSVPYNSLHDKGFVSIGCEPCTRAIQPDEDFRAGRWWWEDSAKKECGLHTHNR